MNAVKIYDCMEASAALHKIINTHYLNVEQMEEQAKNFELKLIKVIQAINDADFACFERKHLEPYRKLLAETKNSVQLIVALLKSDEKV